LLPSGFSLNLIQNIYVIIKFQINIKFFKGKWERFPKCFCCSSLLCRYDKAEDRNVIIIPTRNANLELFARQGITKVAPFLISKFPSSSLLLCLETGTFFYPLLFCLEHFISKTNVSRKRAKIRKQFKLCLTFLITSLLVYSKVFPLDCLTDIFVCGIWNWIHFC